MVSSTSAHAPKLAKASWARGLSRHTGSRGPPGNRSESTERPLASVPKAKKQLSAVTPNGLTAAGVAETGVGFFNRNKAA
jgi:hypothetical protein